MVTKARCACGSPYTRSIGGELVCDACAWLAEARAAVKHAETLRDIAAQISGQAVYRNALYAGAQQLERHALNVEYCVRRMRRHRRGRERAAR